MASIDGLRYYLKRVCMKRACIKRDLYEKRSTDKDSEPYKGIGVLFSNHITPKKQLIKLNSFLADDTPFSR